MNRLLNTHFYDDKIREIYQHCIDLDEVDTDYNLNFVEMLERAEDNIVEYFLESEPKLCQSARATLELFKNDSKNNVDCNGLNVEDIFPRVWRRVEKLNLLNSLYILEQLADVTDSGKCNNGRINRLVQIYFCLF